MATIQSQINNLSNVATGVQAVSAVTGTLSGLASTLGAVASFLGPVGLMFALLDKWNAPNQQDRFKMVNRAMNRIIRQEAKKSIEANAGWKGPGPMPYDTYKLSVASWWRSQVTEAGMGALAPWYLAAAKGIISKSAPDIASKAKVSQWSEKFDAFIAAMGDPVATRSESVPQPDGSVMLTFTIDKTHAKWRALFDTFGWWTGGLDEYAQDFGFQWIAADKKAEIRVSLPLPGSTWSEARFANSYNAYLCAGMQGKPLSKAAPANNSEDLKFVLARIGGPDPKVKPPEATDFANYGLGWFYALRTSLRDRPVAKYIPADFYKSWASAWLLDESTQSACDVNL